MHRNTIYLIDGTSICYRSFFAIKLSTSRGFPSGAVYGFFKTLRKILSKYNPSYMGVCFDVSRKTFRQEKFKEYKINRPPIPDDLGTQIPLIKKMVNYLGVTLIEREGFEADDLIATLSKMNDHDNETIVIVSSDKDLFQLLSGERVIMYNPNQDKFWKENDFFKEYGFSPLKIIDFLALAGDSADNIPGAKGIGKVGAAKLVREFSSVENIFDNLDKVSEKMRKIILENKANIFLSKELVTLNACELDVRQEDLKIRDTDYPELYKMFSELEFKSLLKEIPSPSINSAIEVKQEDSSGFLNGLTEDSLCVFLEAGYGYVFNEKKQCVHKAEIKDLRKVLEDEKVTKISYAFKEQLRAFSDLKINGIWFDVKIAAYLIDAAADYELTDLVYRYLGEAVPKIPVLCAPGYIYRLYRILSSRLKEESLDKLFFEVEMPLVEVLADMEKWGVKIDLPAMQSLLEKVERKLEKVQKDIFIAAGKEFNLNSPRQLRSILFDDLKIAPLGKTKTGYSTGVDVLKKLSLNYPIAEFILEYRELSKLKTTYILPLIESVRDKYGKLYAQFNQTGTQTGRLSSASPNLQSIPVKGEFSSDLRGAFISSFKNGRLLSADYSQIELRILAHFSGDERLVEALKNNSDVHRVTAALLFSVSEGEVSEFQRNLAKRVNFGIIYGMGPYGLAQELGITPREAESFIGEYFLRYPKVGEYIQGICARLEKEGEVRTILNRKRFLPDFNSSNAGLREFARRQAVNTPIQGSCADLIKVAMLKIYKAFKQRKLKAKLIIQIHDELIFDLPQDEIEEVVDIVKENMEKSIVLNVPVEVNLKLGKNWADMEKIG